MLEEVLRWLRDEQRVARVHIGPTRTICRALVAFTQGWEHELELSSARTYPRRWRQHHRQGEREAALAAADLRLSPSLSRADLTSLYEEADFWNLICYDRQRELSSAILAVSSDAAIVRPARESPAPREGHANELLSHQDLRRWVQTSRAADLRARLRTLLRTFA